MMGAIPLRVPREACWFMREIHSMQLPWHRRTPRGNFIPLEGGGSFNPNGLDARLREDAGRFQSSGLRGMWSGEMRFQRRAAKGTLGIGAGDGGGPREPREGRSDSTRGRAVSVLLRANHSRRQRNLINGGLKAAAPGVEGEGAPI